MPLSGRPRNPFGETPARFQRRRTRYNPLNAQPNFFHGRPYIDVEVRGQSPGTMFADTRADRQQPATIRRLWRQMIAGVPATPPFSVAANKAVTGNAVGFELTRALRYMASTRYRMAGVWRYSLQRRFQKAQIIQGHIVYMAGNQRTRPVLRNRLTSFGSRVRPLNQPVQGAER